MTGDDDRRRSGTARPRDMYNNPGPLDGQRRAPRAGSDRPNGGDFRLDGRDSEPPRRRPQEPEWGPDGDRQGAPRRQGRSQPSPRQVRRPAEGDLARPHRPEQGDYGRTDQTWSDERTRRPQQRPAASNERWQPEAPGRGPWGNDDHYATFDDEYVEESFEQEYIPAGKVVPDGAREARQKVGSRASAADVSDEPDPDKRRRRLILLGAVVLVVLVVLAVPWFWYKGQVSGSGGDGEQVSLSIPEGSSVAAIGKLLNAQGVTGSPRAWSIYTRLNPPADIQAGDYTLNKGMSFPDAIDVLVKGPAPVPVTKITIPEGLWLPEIAQRVTEAGLDGEAFLKMATDGSVRSKWQPEGVNTLEGLLYPDTYYLGVDNTEADLLKAMIDRFDEQMDSIDLANAAPASGLTPYEAIVMGSLIEGEAKLPQDRANISSVMHNRIEKGMPLQIDATVIFAKGERITRVLYKDLEIDSPFNTYQNKGLPPSPIAASRVESIDAAVHPADTDYIYYMVISSDGAHGFASNEAGRQELFREAKANGVR